jgi:hypothetical protein
MVTAASRNNMLISQMTGPSSQLGRYVGEFEDLMCQNGFNV